MPGRLYLQDGPLLAIWRTSAIRLTQIPKLGCKIYQIHAAFSVGESNFGEVGGGQCKRLLNSGFRCE